MNHQPHIVHETWLPVGANDVAEIGREKIEAAIAGLNWLNTKNKLTLPFSQGMGIKGIIDGFHLKATRVAFNDDLAPCTLLAVEAQHPNGKSRLYCIDHGHAVTPVRSDFYPSIPEMETIQ